MAFAFAAAVNAPPALAGGGIDPLSGIDFVRITHPGNAPWMGDGTEGDRAVGRGSVGYEYSIGRFEVTTSQWIEFFNAAYDRPAGDAPLPHLIPPTFWGATGTTPINNSNPNARRWQVPAGNEMRPVGNISWRMAAMYCNWLHNNQSTDRQAFLNGAYDVSTFGYLGQSGIFTDQWAHHPDARYWIPTWDEHLKASHYDPALNNGEGGWWRYNISSDTAPVYGPPGVTVNGQPTQANGLWDSADFPGFSPFTVPLGAYTDVMSPWGLFDTAGGTAEWTEEVLLSSGIFPLFRVFDGSAWAGDGTTNDLVGIRGGDSPSFSFYDLGFRVASSVPSPGSSALGIGLIITLTQRRRRMSTLRSTVNAARPSVACLLAVGGMSMLAAPAAADIDPVSGIDFVRITHPGNAPWMGDGTPGDRAIGRGGVDYEYFIGRFEVTTSQWVQFFNAAYDRPAGDAPLPHLIPPTFWGASGTTPINSSNPNARRWQVPAGNEMLPVGNISWRMAAMYCNFLHNGGAGAVGPGGVVPRDNFLDGAYDVSTFGYVGNVFTDQLTHHAGARYWIPTWDEHLKASHYDPHRYGPDQGGWWLYNTTSDTAPIPGLPPSMGGAGQTNAGGWSGPSFSIPLAAYADVTSPWGLFDTSGATAEWTESVFSGPGLPPVRIYDGSWWVDGPTAADQVHFRSSSFPSLSTFDLGLRVASSVPGPSSCMLLLLAGALGARRTRRGSHDKSHFQCSDMRRDAGIGAGIQRGCRRGTRLGYHACS